ncbi:flagellar motor switch phosphatase FliY [Selenomonas sp. TAMA-11512]|uniref:flagellar motor switch phosphatase FliY n=1 Tax=Selenomonas sp. TAMA-11512 TaxID=3095337 RepID=UPI003092D571|nr:flagellar motor switch phosphatase FliY [Selenomonas sp. TAMA-11512]
MSDDLISQEEIDALLSGGAGGGDSDASPAADAGSADATPLDGTKTLNDMEKDALGEIGNISMGSAATTLSVLLGHKVSITTPAVSIDTLSSIKDQYPMPYLIVEIGYTIGIEGSNVLAIQATDASIIADLMMGGDGSNTTTELNEIHMSAVGEAMNQMMGSVATSLSSMFNKKIDISPPKVNMIDLGSEEKITEIIGNNDPIAKVSFRMEVDGLIDSEIMQILPIPVAEEMVSYLLSGGGQEEEEPEPVQATPPPPTPAAAPAPVPAAAPPPVAAPAMMPAQPAYGTPVVGQSVPVQPAMFSPLATQPVQINDANIGLILDVPLQVTVELGRTKKTIKDILDLTNGSIIELDKLAGEPVDIQVNGKFLAKGEVVVIDENFGVRITDIVSPEERAAKLQ